MINHNNYKVFYQKYLNNELEESLIGELFLFLEYNPELIDELDVEQIKLTPEENIFFENKSTLYKPDENQFISYIENQMNDEEKILFEKKVNSDKNLIKELELYQLTKLKPDLNIRFEEKAKLKKSVIYYLFRENKVSFGIAASVVVIFCLILLIKKISQENERNNLSVIIQKPKSNYEHSSHKSQFNQFTENSQRRNFYDKKNVTKKLIKNKAAKLKTFLLQKDSLFNDENLIIDTSHFYMNQNTIDLLVNTNDIAKKENISLTTENLDNQMNQKDNFSNNSIILYTTLEGIPVEFEYQHLEISEKKKSFLERMFSKKITIQSLEISYNNNTLISANIPRVVNK